MTVLLVLAAWLLVAVVVSALFCALVRGGRALTPSAPPPTDVALPTQRTHSDERSPAPVRSSV